jgi:nucleotide-binding universal stress UspA family protein
MGFKQILVTLDGSDAAQAALNYAEQIASPGAHIHLLNVASRAATAPLPVPAGLYSENLMRDVNWPPLSSAEDSQTLHDREEYLAGRGGWLIDKGFEVTSEIKFGNVIETVVEVAHQGFDVIVMTTHGRTGLARLAMGSVAEGVLHKVACPVLLIPTRALSVNS